MHGPVYIKFPLSISVLLRLNFQASANQVSCCRYALEWCCLAAERDCRHYSYWVASNGRLTLYDEWRRTGFASVLCWLFNEVYRLNYLCSAERYVLFECRILKSVEANGLCVVSPHFVDGLRKSTRNLNQDVGSISRNSLSLTSTDSSGVTFSATYVLCFGVLFQHFACIWEHKTVKLRAGNQTQNPVFLKMKCWTRTLQLIKLCLSYKCPIRHWNSPASGYSTAVKWP